MRGRKPKPASMKNSRVSHRRIRPDATIDARAECPQWLSDTAKAEWRRVSPILEALGVLTAADEVPFAAYCTCVAEWEKAQRFVQENGQVVTLRTDKGEIRSILPAPEVGIAVRMLDKIRQFAGEFGMTPSARGRIEIDLKPDQIAGMDPARKEKLSREIQKQIEALESTVQ